MECKRKKKLVETIFMKGQPVLEKRKKKREMLSAESFIQHTKHYMDILFIFFSD